MANIEQQLAQQDLATGIKLAGMGAESSAATGYAAGAGAARALGGLFGMEDPRIVEQRALTKAIEEMEAAGGFRDPNNLYKMGEFLIKQGDFERGSQLIELGNQLVGYQGRGAEKPRDIPKLDKDNSNTIRTLLDEAGYNVSGLDFSGKDFPEGMSEDRVINAIWAVHQKFNIDLGSAVDQVIADIENRVGSPVPKQSTGKAPTYKRPE
jgi:hypothetical protein